MNRLQDVTLLRAFAVLSLVMWHCYCPYICWGTAESPLNGVYTKLFTSIIPDANMPLFTFLSGYLFCYLHEEKGKYKDFKGFLVNKVHRLLIPFLVIGSLMNLTMYGRSLTEILYGQPNHLWYCLMLFYIYVLFWLIHNKLGYRLNMLCAFLSFCVVFYYGSGALNHRMLGGVFLPLYYYIYFYAGFTVFKYKSKILDYRLLIVILCCFIYAVTVIVDNTHLIIFKCLGYVLILIIICSYFAKHMNTYVSKKTFRMIEQISYCSFGIYVFHQYILWNLTRVPESLGFIKPYMEVHYIVSPIALFILAFILSFFITKMALKTKVGRYFLL